MGVAGVAGLSAREFDVLALMSEGLTNEAIAERTFLSVKSIEAVVRSIFAKLGLVDSPRANRRVLAVRAFLERPGRSGGELPVPVSSFVGRHAELAALSELVEVHPLLTIAGAGGIGKTRLVVELARRSAGDGRPWRFVDLAGTLDDPLTQVAAAFGLTFATESGARRQLQRALRVEPHVVVLDNAEHLLPAVRSLVPTLLEPEQAQVVVTSRRPLGVAGEAVWRTPPLRPADAATLLCERTAEATGHAVSLPDHVVAAWTERLDGIPLAIELFVPHLAATPIDELSSRLDELPAMLHGSSDGRHRGLQAVLDSSVAALSQRAVATFRRSSVFVGGFTIAAARQVSSAVASRAEVADDLGELVRCSLVEFSAGRYRLLEPVRQHAADLLARSADEHDAHDAFIRWTREFCQRASMEVAGDPAVWRAQLEVEAGNIEAAIDSACRRGLNSHAVAMIASLFLYWTSDRPATGRRLSAHVLDNLDGAAGPSQRAWALLATGSLTAIGGSRQVAEDMLRQAVDLFVVAGDQLGECLASLWLGQHTGTLDPLDRAARVARTIDVPVIEAWALLFRGGLVSQQWESYAARSAQIDRVESIAQSISSVGLHATIANARAVAMLVANWTGEAQFDPAAIDEVLAECLRLAEQDRGFRTVEGIRNLRCLARLHHGPRDLAQADIDEHLTLVPDTEDRRLMAEAVLIAASHLHQGGNSGDARQLLALAAPVFRAYAHDDALTFILHATPELIPDALAAPPDDTVTTEQVVAATSLAQQLLRTAHSHAHLGPRSCPMLTTMGRFGVVIDGEPVPDARWGSKQARVLLKRLVVARGRPVSRDTLFDLLWPDEVDRRRLSARLSVQLSSVRRVLPHGVVADRSSVWLDLVQVDVDIERWYALSDDEAVVEGYTGEFLPEDRYEDWTCPLRDKIRARFVDAAHQLALRRSQRDAIELWRQVLREDRYDERAHRSLIAALRAQGHLGQARAAYQDYIGAMNDLSVEAVRWGEIGS